MENLLKKETSGANRGIGIRPRLDFQPSPARLEYFAQKCHSAKSTRH